MAILKANTYWGYIGLDPNALMGVYLFNGKTSTSPTVGIYSITVLFNGDSEILINTKDSKIYYYTYIELV